jgi:hypothetical protein
MFKYLVVWWGNYLYLREIGDLSVLSGAALTAWQIHAVPRGLVDERDGVEKGPRKLYAHASWDWM